MSRFSTRRALPKLLFFAMLIVCVAILIPVAVSASGTPANSGEIENFGYQILNGTDVKESADTDLRFLFSINNLDYNEVGFVFSTSDDPLKTDNPKPNYKAMTKAYRSVTANSKEIPAPNGRFWVAVKLSDIPHASFATYVYIRPYVKDGNGTRYGETKRINVCEALGHVHEIKNPTGTATLLNPGTRCGDCDACGLTGITELDVRAAVADTLVENRFLNGNSSAGQFDEAGLVRSALANGETFYPSAENNYEGRDFYFQIDILWNRTMVNCYNDEIKLCFYQDSNTKSALGTNYSGKNASFYYFTPKDNSSCWNTYAGGFDWGTGNTALEGPKEAENRGKLFDRYANLNDSPDTRDWGWHRIGVRVHQDADTDGNTVTYSGYTCLYIDGEQRWKIDLNPSDLKTWGMLLYTMDTNRAYTANSFNVYFDFWAADIAKSGTACYMVTANKTFDAVKPSDFETGVVPVDDPVASNYVLGNDAVVPAKVYFMAEHPHDWDGNPVVTREATVLQAGKRADHCKLCGAENPNGEAVAFVPTVYTSTNGTFGENDDVPGVGLSNSLASTRGSEHFYPIPQASNSSNPAKDYRNLYFEYSILWNNTLQNWDDVTEGAEMKVITFYKSGKHKEFYLLYTRSNSQEFYTSTDCPFANHFDFSCYHEYNADGIINGVYDGGGQAGFDSPVLESSSPSIGAYGWHRIGVLVHQEASGNGSTVNYLGWSALYVDGVKVWKVKSDFRNKDSYLAVNGLSLFTATSSNSKLTYSDTTPDVRCRFDRFATSGNPAYAIFGDARWRIVDTDFDPSTEFEPVVSPAAVDYVIPGTNVHVNGAVYFRAR